MGDFPSDWKEAIITPVLKKGEKNLHENYRPVSCLPAAAKLLEMLICNQVSNHMESNKLIPEIQHASERKDQLCQLGRIFKKTGPITLKEMKQLGF